jgi:hypothetical protein
MGRACSMHARCKMYMKLYSITSNGRHLFTDLGVDGKILKWILDKLGGVIVNWIQLTFVVYLIL